MKRAAVIVALAIAMARINAPAQEKMAGFALIPSGKFEMGDHHGFVDPAHGSDETPVHTVRLDAFYIGIYDVTTREYCEFLNAALAQHQIEVRKGGVYLVSGNDLLCDTRESSISSPIGRDGNKFSVLGKKENHPMVCVRWHGAVVFCNWLSAQKKAPLCYNTTTWDCDFNRSGFRLPTEAEWECAARGGQQDPYYNYPWGNDADPTKANVPESNNPFRAGARPPSPPPGYKAAAGPPGQAWRIGAHALTTPVGFFNGKLQRKADFGWPGDQETFQTSNGANAFGLYDMAGNVWQWCTEWYERNYYAYSPSENPPGPAEGSPMPDGKRYRCMRGGSWFNGEFGHSRVSNRDPSYYRGPDPVTGFSDPDGPWFHIGFRVIRPVNAESRPVIRPTPVRRMTRNDLPPGGDRESPLGGRSPGEPNRPPRPGQSGGQRPGAPRDVGRTRLSLALGADGNGVLSTREIENAAKILKALDRNGDGKLTADELDDPNEAGGPGPGGPRRPVGGPLMRVLDADRNGELSASEIAKAPSALMAADADKDGTLTREEVDAVGGGGGGGNRVGGPPPPAAQGNGGNRGPQGGGQRRGGGGGGGRITEDNKTPTSPNPGQTVGLFLNTPKAFTGYTLMAPKHNIFTFLMDNQGRVVHQWKSIYEPGQTAYLLPNGHLLRAAMLKVPGGTGGGEGGRIEEYDWDGKLVWEFDHATTDYQLHHDIKPLPNGHVLALMVERKSREEAIAAGFAPRLLRDDFLVPDAVVEIEPVLPKGGRIVWEWRVWDHLIQDSDRTKLNYGDVAAHPERIDTACNGGATPAFWNHMNSLDYNAQLDQIALSVRGCNEIWILDHSTTTQEAASHTGGKCGRGGDLIYRWGNPAAYKRGPEREAQLNQQHDAEWIPDGYPGAGHITIFNNGYNRGYSSIEEIVPPIDANGRYTIEPGIPYGPDMPVWHYEAKNRADFFSSEISGAHRLPNGNTLICAGVIGHLFEVTPNGETVWQYVNPMVRDGVLAQGELPGKDMRGHLWNAVFKVYRYAPDYSGLAGRDLTPKGVIERPASEKGKTGLDNMSVEKARTQSPGLDNLRSLGYMK